MDSGGWTLETMIMDGVDGNSYNYKYHPGDKVWIALNHATGEFDFDITVLPAPGFLFVVDGVTYNTGMFHTSGGDPKRVKTEHDITMDQDELFKDIDLDDDGDAAMSSGNTVLPTIESVEDSEMARKHAKVDEILVVQEKIDLTKKQTEMLAKIKKTMDDSGTVVGKALLKKLGDDNIETVFHKLHLVSELTKPKKASTPTASSDQIPPSKRARKPPGYYARGSYTRTSGGEEDEEEGEELEEGEDEKEVAKAKGVPEGDLESSSDEETAKLHDKQRKEELRVGHSKGYRGKGVGGIRVDDADEDDEEAILSEDELDSDDYAGGESEDEEENVTSPSIGASDHESDPDDQPWRTPPPEKKPKKNGEKAKGKEAATPRGSPKWIVKQEPTSD